MRTLTLSGCTLLHTKAAFVQVGTGTGLETSFQIVLASINAILRARVAKLIEMSISRE
jgi:hypothetical protein